MKTHYRTANIRTVGQARRWHGYACRIGLALALSAPIAIGGSASAAEPTAQPATDAQSATDAANQLETVTVTARYRSENLQETPIAITALSGDGLDSRIQQHC